MKKITPPVLLLFTLLLLSRAAAGEEEAHPDATDTEGVAKDQPERIFIVNEYRYEPGAKSGDADLGQSLCGTRCNALSVDYQNYLGPPGWRITRIAHNKEIPVDLNNPYLDGTCICVADEYIVRVTELYKVR